MSWLDVELELMLYYMSLSLFLKVRLEHHHQSFINKNKLCIEYFWYVWTHFFPSPPVIQTPPFFSLQFWVLCSLSSVAFRRLERLCWSALHPSSSSSLSQWSQTQTSTRICLKCSWVLHLEVCWVMPSFISFLTLWVSPVTWPKITCYTREVWKNIVLHRSTL